MVLNGIEAGFLLDRQWHLLRGEMDTSKQPALLSLIRVLDAAALPYAIIGGVALQVHQNEPRTTLDIDLAVTDLDVIPREALNGAGFTFTGRFVHTENWVDSSGVPVQFTADPLLRDAIERADEVTVGVERVRVIGVADLVHEKLRAGTDPARRRSKRIQDLADVQALLEQQPALEKELTDAEQAVLRTLPA
jgi:hypothetical protein